jgi:hypothetical protein
MKKQLTGAFAAETPYWTDVTLASQPGATIDKVTYYYDDNMVADSANLTGDGAVKCHIDFPYLKVAPTGVGATINGLTLALNPPYPNLTLADIALSGPGIAKTLADTSAAAGAKYTLSVTGITGQAAIAGIEVRIKKGDYANLPPKVPASPIEPTTFLATGGTASYVLDDGYGQWYEVHTFTASGTLSFTNGAPAGLNAWVLVVGGGGSGSACHDPGNGGGAGGVAEHTNYPLMAQSYAVVVGAGGTNVTSSQHYVYPGNNGGNSSFGGNLFVGYGGGGGGGGYTGDGKGKDGGSSGGSGNNAAATATKGLVPTGGHVYGNAGAASSRGSPGNSIVAGGGGAGSAGSGANGGSGITRSITGTEETYAKGGGSNVDASHALSNTGNGGRGAIEDNYPAYGFAGGSGVVIVRFPR